MQKVAVTGQSLYNIIFIHRTSELNRLSRDWRVNWEDSVARTLQGLEDGSPKKVSTRKPKISANVNVTVKGRTIYVVSCIRFLHHFLINFLREITSNFRAIGCRRLLPNGSKTVYRGWCRVLLLWRWLLLGQVYVAGPTKRELPPTRGSMAERWQHGALSSHGKRCKTTLESKFLSEMLVYYMV